MNFYHLKYFATVAESQNFTRAARVLRVSQPALSQQIQALESELNTRLFDRTNKGVILTSSGKVVYAHCKKIFGAINDLKTAINDLNEGTSGELLLGTVNSIGIHVLPNFIKQYKANHPGVRLSVKYKPSEEVIQMLLEDQLDAAIIATNRTYQNLVQINFLENEMYLVTSPHHPFTEKETISLSDLQGQELIAFDKKTPTRAMVDELLSQRGIDMNITLESENIETIKTMVSIGMGVAFIPEHAIRLELRTGLLKRIQIDEPLPLKRNVSLLYKENRYLTKAAEEFVQLFDGANAEKLLSEDPCLQISALSTLEDCSLHPLLTHSEESQSDPSCHFQ